MEEKNSLQRFFKKCGCDDNGGIIILLILGALLLVGEDLLEWIICDDMALIWIVLLVLLLTNFDLDGHGCCC